MPSNTQTWWDAVCNMNPFYRNWWGHKDVTNSSQFYGNTLDVQRGSFTDEPPEEQFMFLCFMSEAFDD